LEIEASSFRSALCNITRLPKAIGGHSTPRPSHP
jgi:hypothetical protein